MANYIDAQRTTFSKEEELRFRKLFNQWAASISGYNRNNLGNELKIVEVYNSPIYRCSITTQYDHRELNMKYKRVNGKVCPPRTIERASQIDRWGMFPLPTIYTNIDKSYYVSGSEYITNCPTCSGAGRVNCSKCGGKGKITREIVKERICSACKGYGYTYITKHRKEQQKVLDTDGKYRFRYVDKEYSEKVTCQACGGNRKFTDITYRDEPCSECHSSGKVTCSTCYGDGKMIHYWQLTKHQYCQSFTEYRFPSVISYEDAQKMESLVERPNYAWENIEILRSDNGRFSNENLIGKPLIGKIIAKFPSKVEHNLNTAVCFSDIKVEMRSARTVVYQVDGEQYSCMVLIGDEWKLLTINSPISKKVNSLKESVNEYCRKHQYGKAWALLQEVNKYPQAGSKEAQMQQELEERMAMMTKFGANIALVLCTLGLSPLLYLLYGPYKFYAFWSSWLMDKFNLSAGHLMLFTIIAIMFVTIKFVIPNIPESAHRVASPSKRFLYGFKIGTFSYIFLALAAALLSYFGILQVATSAAMLVLKIVIFIVMLVMFLLSGIFKIFS